MKYDLDDLIAGIDIADLLGVTNAAVGNWRLRHIDFPKPVVVVGRGNLPIFSRAEVLEWALATNRIKR